MKEDLKCCLHPTDGLRKHGFTAAFDGKALLKNLNLTYKGKGPFTRCGNGCGNGATTIGFYCN